MLIYHNEKDLEDILNAINTYEIRNTKKPTNNIREDSVVNLASGVLVIDNMVQSISVDLKLYDLTIVKETTCKKYRKSEIIIFEKVNELIMFLCKSYKEQLLSDTDFRIGQYAW